jgi:hypothetical protein
MFLSASTLALLAGPALAQEQADTSKPIVIKTMRPKTKREIFKGDVLNVTASAITVRSREDEKQIRTFTYSPVVRDRMQKILDKGGYQYGDKVVIETDPGSNIALQIKGKPSKPI